MGHVFDVDGSSNRRWSMGEPSDVRVDAGPTVKNYFSPDELACSHCGGEGFKKSALDSFNSMREECGFPWIVTSAYRCMNHPIEKAKENPGSHSRGTALDVKFRNDEQLLTILRVALNHGVQRVGVNDHAKFVHLDFDVVNSPWAYWQY